MPTRQTLLAVLAAVSLAGCAARPVVLVTGYWPPTNEMLRPLATNPAQNPGGWQGRNWRNLGYDIYAYFPEFPPDGDPTNDQIGDPGSVGAPDSTLRVDYQATSRDFWQLVDRHQPVILITTSRGGDIAWELEALEGGHDGGSADPAEDWRSDEHGIGLPTQRSVDPRSWAMLSTYRQGNTLPSNLPLQAIKQAVLAVGVDAQVDHETSGNYLSGFMGLHGVYYQHSQPTVQMAGHIHVGTEVSVADAERALAATLEVVLSRP